MSVRPTYNRMRHVQTRHIIEVIKKARVNEAADWVSVPLTASNELSTDKYTGISSKGNVSSLVRTSFKILNTYSGLGMAPMPIGECPYNWDSTNQS